MNQSFRKIKGHPSMTEAMRRVLLILKAAHDAGEPFVTLEKPSFRNIQSLIHRDWIVESKGLDGIKYTITSRGLRALKDYETRKFRSDGLCPHCGEHPKRVYSTGRVGFYCYECGIIHQRKQYALKKHQLSPEGICPRCKTNPRHIFPSGKAVAYCHQCGLEKRREEHARRQKRDLERLERGEVLLCSRCQERPRHRSENYLYIYCHECQLEDQRKQARNKRRRKIEQKLRGRDDP